MGGRVIIGVNGRAEAEPACQPDPNGAGASCVSESAMSSAMKRSKVSLAPHSRRVDWAWRERGESRRVKDEHGVKLRRTTRSIVETVDLCPFSGLPKLKEARGPVWLGKSAGCDPL